MGAALLCVAHPRAQVLNPIRLFAGSFGGPTLWENPEFVSPNDIRAAERGRKGGKYAGRLAAQHEQVSLQTQSCACL
jgi:ribosome biogenesis protein BRX1